MNNYIYILIMVLVTVAVRILPITVLRKPIQNRFIRSFLYYVPYVTIALMTFPAILEVTASPWPGLIAFVIAIALSWLRVKMYAVAGIAVVIVLITQLLF